MKVGPSDRRLVLPARVILTGIAPAPDGSARIEADELDRSLEAGRCGKWFWMSLSSLVPDRQL
jgi:hypothetical protein